MKRKTSLVTILAFLFVFFSLVACSGASTPEPATPTPDVDATVAAAIAATVEFEAQVEAAVATEVASSVETAVDEAVEEAVDTLFPYHDALPIDRKSVV